MNWKKELDELSKREKLAEKMGGKEKLNRQKENNRLNVRERINLLLDKLDLHHENYNDLTILSIPNSHS